MANIVNVNANDNANDNANVSYLLYYGGILMTIKDIAALAGVSHTTVSRVLNNKPDVKPETRKYILEIIKKYNYQPNASAVMMSSKKSNCIGLIIPYTEDFVLTNPHYADVIRGITSVLNKYGYFTLFCYTDKEDYINRVYNQGRVDGFIALSPTKHNSNMLMALKLSGAPFISTVRVPDEKDIIYVDVDNYIGSTTAMEYLISLGHRRIGFIRNGSGILSSSQERYRGYLDVLAKHGIECDEELVKIGDTSMKGGYNAVKELLILEKGKMPTAVFVAADMMAIGAIQAVKDLGMKIPGDISIMGFDDIPQAEYIDPAITTVRQPSYEKGKKAARLLVDKLEGKRKNIRSVLLDTELIVRSSTKYINK
jgi:LacI family transcriptional regulator